MTQLHPPVQCCDAAIAGRLVEHRIALHGLREGFRIALLPDVERIETGAQHEHELVAQHLPDGAQFAAIVEALKQPEVSSRLAADGSTPVGSSPEQFNAHIKAEVAKWSKLVKAANMKFH